MTENMIRFAGAAGPDHMRDRTTGNERIRNKTLAARAVSEKACINRWAEPSGMYASRVAHSQPL